MTFDDDHPSLFDDVPDPEPPPRPFPTVPAHEHARRTDVSTSHDAARQLTTGRSQCVALLRAYATAGAQLDGMTDEEAGHAAGLTMDAQHKRGADLRRLGLIAWRMDGDQLVRRKADSGRYAGVSVITEQGIAELARIDGEAL